MSTFGLLNTAYSGLAAARAALDTTGQNVANVNTAGYTRQRVEQTSIDGVANSQLFANGLNLGQGAKVTGITRVTDALVDARVRDTASSSGYWTAASAALSTAETGLGEPGDTGLSTALTDFWGAWQQMGNNPGDAGVGADLITKGQALTSRIAAGWTTASKQWSDARGATADTVTSVNTAAKQIAALNKQILLVKATGGNSNELLDQRSTAISALAGQTGATTRQNVDGTVDVILGGTTMVAGTTTRQLQLAGSPTMAAAATTPVRLEFTDAPGAAVQVDGGTLAAQLTTLGPAANGSGGVYAETAAAFDGIATALAAQVNAAHEGGQTSTGSTGLDFFRLGGAGTSAALTLAVVPTDVGGIAAAGTGKGAYDGSNADTIGAIGTSGSGSPDALWSAFVSRIGAQSKAAATQSSVAGSAATAATGAQTSESGVDLDEETANLVVYQHAYQGAARVLTAVDEMLDTLINRTGIVGRG